LYRNLANSLTVARLILTPFVVAAILNGHNRLAFGLVIAAGASDGLDGFLARRLNAASRFGAYLDPIADKALLVSIYVAFGIAHVLPWWLVGIVLGRDVLILGMVAWGILFTSIRSFPPSIWGKLTTFTQIGAVVILLADARPYFSRKLLLACVTTTTVWSAVHYAARGIRLLRKERIDGAAKRG
jgi:cardiolipin synthase